VNQGALHQYRFGSVRLDAALPLPGFDHCRAAGGAAGAFTLALRRAGRPPARGRLALRGRGRRLLEVWRRPDGGYLLAAAGVAPCSLEPDGRTLAWHLAAGREPGADDTDFVVATVLPRALTSQGAAVLHAAALLGPSGAVVVCGGSRSGKSTLAVAAHRATGWPLLGDDAAVVGLEDGEPVLRSCAQDVRVWDDVRDLLELPAGTRLPRHGGKARHPLGGRVAGPVPIAVVARLVDAEPAGAARLGAARRLVALRDNLLRLDRSDPAVLAREFAVLVALARAVPVVELRHPHDRGRLHDAVERLARLATEARAWAPATT
jgi:hypothetical protein